MGRSQPVAGQQLWHQPPELAWMLSAACLADPSLAAGSSPSADAAKNISERLPVMQLHLLSICSASAQHLAIVSVLLTSMVRQNKPTTNQGLAMTAHTSQGRTRCCYDVMLELD